MRSHMWHTGLATCQFFENMLLPWRLINWLIYLFIVRFIDCLIDCFTDGLFDWLIDWLIDCLIDWLIDWLIDCLIDWLIDWLIDVSLCVCLAVELCGHCGWYIPDGREGPVCLVDNGNWTCRCLLLSHHFRCVCHLPHLVHRMLRNSLQEQNHSDHCTSAAT